MSEEFDLVVRGGTIIDGTGGEPYQADVAISNGKFAAIGHNLGRGREEIDAKGKLVTPGFVDIHTHYDGQAIWSDRLSPSSQHGVTTVVAGNCGVGFAPCRPQDHELLIHVMEGVEDIPETVMTEGLDWNWETFPEYLNALESRPHDIDFAAYLPHSALRVYVMGARGANREIATDEDLARMKALAEEAMEAGAIGFATSRFFSHRTRDGENIPSFEASERELAAISSALKDTGRGVLQFVLGANAESNLTKEVKMVRRLVEVSHRPASFTMAAINSDGNAWREIMVVVDTANADGLPIKAQIFPRPVGMISGFKLSVHPFSLCPTYQKLDKLPHDQKMAELRKPDVRATLLKEKPSDPIAPITGMGRLYDYMFPIDPEAPNYEPAMNTSIAALAKTRDISPEELAYDLLLERNGDAMFLLTLTNYPNGSLDTLYEIIQRDNTILGLGDGGAHYGMICDASYPTFVLAHWTRDRKGSRIALPQAIRALTLDPARAIGFLDRGRIAPGYKGDLNVIDYDKVKLEAPRVIYDLPAGGRRLMQGAKGFSATIVAGQVTYRDGVATGALPGKLVRGQQTLAQRVNKLPGNGEFAPAVPDDLRIVV